MDYTLSPDYATDAGTGHRMHQQTSPVTTEVTDKDVNSLIWSLMEVVNDAGLTPQQFDPTVSASYRVFRQALDKLFAKRAYCPRDMPWLAVGDAITNDTAAMVSFLADVPDGATIDLDGGQYAIYQDVPGAATGDAVALDAMLRLANKKNITFRNGRIFAANPSTSGTKVRFPSTLALDGCTGIKFYNVDLEAKGENWGASDDSAGLDSEARRAFLAQNGGHALVMTRCSDIYADPACTFLRCGSVAPVYSASSDNIKIAGYSSAMSLGYAAFAADSWCGGSSVSGFARHRMYLLGARTDANGASYGSKACLTAEDRDVYVYVYGGTFKDAYANGSAHELGNAFVSNGAHVYVHDADVENCASLGMTTNNITDDTVLEMTGVSAKGLRLTQHIFDATSFGAHKVIYRGCHAEIVGGGTWAGAEPEFSITTLVANRKVTSGAFIDFIDCTSTGADTATLNASRASYGGVRFVNGRHDCINRIFDSVGWGGGTAGSGRGFELQGAVHFTLSSTSPSAALSVATTAINAIKNQDSWPTDTYQFLDFQRSVVIESAIMREFMSVSSYGTGLVERRFLGQRLVNCFQAANPAGDGYASRVKFISAGVASGGNIPLTFTLLDNKLPTGGVLVDDAYANRRFLSVSSGPTLVGAELQATFMVNSTVSNFTAQASYSINFSG